MGKMTNGRLFGRIALCALCMALLSVLVGCGSTQTPTQAADTFMQSLKSSNNNVTSVQDIFGSTNVTGEEGNDLVDTQVEDLIVQKLLDFDYTIGNESINGDTATVQVTIKTYNLGDAFTSFFTDYMQQALVMAFAGGTQEQIEELGLQILEEKVNSMPKDYESTIPLNFDKVNGEWQVEDINDQENFVNALTGGYLTALEELTSSMSEEGASTI